MDTPLETALKVIKDETNLVVHNRAHFLSLLDAMDFKGESVNARMPFVLGLMSMWFSTNRAAKRLGVDKRSVENWRKKSDTNNEMYLKAKGRGELMLEEVILAAAERDPEWANNLLNKSAKDDDDLGQDEVVHEASAFLK